MLDKSPSSIRRWVSLGWTLLFAPLFAFAAQPVVVASIKPVHALAAGVMQGVGEPLLLIPGGASPHEYNLKPSDIRALDAAQVVFWIGPDLESFLVKPLANAKTARFVALMDAPGLTVLPLRAGGAWETHDHDSDPDHDHDPAASRDAHIWLDPINAIAMARRMATVLGEVDPAHQAEYIRNGAALIERLERLDQQLASDLAPAQEQPYLVFHDAYHYFEQRYGLNAVGSVVLDPAQRPGAKRVAEIRARIREREVRCVFSEPQFQPALAETVIAGSSARRGVLDPLGADLPAGPDAYFQLLQGLSEALRSCLAGA